MPPSVSGTRPRPWVRQTETGAPTSSKDCGPRALINALHWASGNRVGPTSEGNKAQRSYTALIRRAMGRPGTVSTSVDDWHRALTGPIVAELFAAKGLEAPSVKRLQGADWNDDGPAHLAAGRLIMLAVDYGEVRESPAPVGSGTFSEGHAIDLVGYTLQDGLIWTVVYDGLLGSPATVRYRWYRDGAGRFGARPWGIGRMEALSVAKAKRIVVTPPPDPEPEPEPGPVTAAELIAVEGMLHGAQDALAALIERLEA